MKFSGYLYVKESKKEKKETGYKSYERGEWIGVSTN